MTYPFAAVHLSSLRPFRRLILFAFTACIWLVDTSRTKALSVVDTDPANGANDSSVASFVTVTFDQPVDGATINSNTFIVSGDQQGIYAGFSFLMNPTQVVFGPNLAYVYGERITVDLTAGIRDAGNTTNLNPYQFQFTIETIACGPNMKFLDSGQSLGAGMHRGLTLGDVDGDGDFDAFVTERAGTGDVLWLNDGSGTFTMSPQPFDVVPSEGADFGDVDNDGDLDIFVVNQFNPNSVWLNNGAGVFLHNGQMLGGFDWSTAVKLGDLDGDGDLDAFVTESELGDKVFMNNGAGVFIDSGQVLGVGFSNGRDVDLGDLDGDGDLDAVVANTFAITNRVWINNGGGVFSLGQSLGMESSTGVELGDLDGDNDLDIFFTNEGPEPNTVWLNDGTGSFVMSPQLLGFEHSQSVSLGDLDSDGDLDAFIAQNVNHPNRIFENDGSGFFSDSGQTMTGPDALNVELADLDGDGDLDAFLANTGGNTLWLNQCLLEVVNHSPGSGEVDVSTSPVIQVSFDSPYDPGSIGSSNVIIHGDHHGVYSGSLTTVSATTIQFTAFQPFGFGEEITFELLSGIQRIGGGSLIPYQFRFEVQVISCGTVTVMNLSQSLGMNWPSDSVDLGDVDGDGDLDAVVGYNFFPDHKVYLNDGSGFLADSGQSLGSFDGEGLELGDLDGDGDLDLFIGGNFGGSRVYTNNGFGVFGDTGESLGNADGVRDVELGDADGDGDLDAFTVVDGARTNQLWLNNGSGVFTSSGEDLLAGNARGLDLGDFDGDGDLDLAVAFNSGANPNRVLFNDGTGRFTASGQNLGTGNNEDVDSGDIDGDGDLDLVIARIGAQPNLVWTNDGSGLFSNSGQALGNFNSYDVELADVNGDGHLDIYSANLNAPDKIWYNNGSGIFTDSGIVLASTASQAVDLGDLDGDGDQDAFVANNNRPDSIWLNDCLINLGDFVWEDTDGDGIQAFSEPGIPNVLVELYDGVGSNLILSTMTGVDGFYLFVDLPNNTNYEVRVTPPVGYSFTLKDQGGDDTIDSDIDAGGVNVSVTGTDLTIDAGLLPPFQVLSTVPTNGMNDQSTNQNITVIFDQAVDGSTVNSNTFVVSGDQYGLYSGTFIFLLNQVAFVPDVPFGVGEWITVNLLNGIQNQGNTESLLPYQFQFTIETVSCSPNVVFLASGQMLPSFWAEKSRLADFDGDGDLDAFVTINFNNHILYINDGSGTLTNSGQAMFGSDSRGMDVGDIDGDGALDVAIGDGGDTRLWMNDGSGIFMDSGQSFSTAGGPHDGIALGDVDGDGDLDLFIAKYANTPNRVYLNDGSGMFSDSGQLLGASSSRDVSLRDLDGDGDLDAFIADNLFSSVWLNDGTGLFTDSGQMLPGLGNFAVALGDLDGDGDLDAFQGNEDGGGPENRVYLNNGSGVFIDSGQLLGNLRTQELALGDVDGDGDLDVLAVNISDSPNMLWINNGSGIFGNPQPLGASSSFGADFGDLDGDGDLDLFVGNALHPDVVYINDCLVSLGDTVWLDADFNGIQDGSETGLPNVVVELYDGPGGLLLASTNTDVNGQYLFAGLMKSVAYHLEVVPPINYGFTLLNQGGDDSIDSDIGPTGVTVFVTGDNFTIDAGLVPPFSIVQHTPANGTINVGVGQSIVVTFDAAVDTGTVDSTSFKVFGNHYGAYSGSVLLLNSTTIQFSASSPFAFGEEITVNLLSGIRSLSGRLLAPYQFVFVAQALGCGPAAMMNDTGQSLSTNDSTSVELADLDDDGDLDAFVANHNAQPNRVWFNDGSGVFTDSGQSLGSGSSEDVALGDVDGDGDFDAVVANDGFNRIYRNNGAGGFSDSGLLFDNQVTTGVRLGDLNGDGHLDIVVIDYNVQNRVFLNNGAGSFVPGPAFGAALFSRDIELGDVDRDGDLDAVVGNRFGHNNILWLNDGQANFSFGQTLGANSTEDLDLGDLNGDGHLDVFITHSPFASEIWLNDTVGGFFDIGERYGAAFSQGVELGDLDGDGDLDAMVAQDNANTNEVWLGEGFGTFENSGQNLGITPGRYADLGDLDGDGDLDVFLVNDSGRPNLVFLNSDCGTDISLTKISLPSVLQLSSNFQYQIVVSNLGTVAASGLVVTDSLPAFIVFDPIGSAPACFFTNGSVVCSLGSLGAGASTTVAIYVTALPGLGAVATNTAVGMTQTPETNLMNNSAEAVTMFPDTDGDGMRDYFDPDDDSDGMLDCDEIIANTNPFDMNSFLWLQIDRTLIQSTHNLTFPTSTGKTYRIESTTDLLSGPWDDVQTNIMGTGGALMIPDNRAEERLYYRIGVE